MSTRANIQIQTNSPHGQSVMLYRHCDGYVSETGVDLYKALIEACPDGKVTDLSYNRLLIALLGQSNEATTYRAAHPVFETTSSVHGDIECFYRVSLRHDDGVRIYYAGREVGVDPFGEKVELERAADVHSFGLEDWKKLCNQELRAANTRITDLNARQPNGPQYEPYPLLA